MKEGDRQSVPDRGLGVMAIVFATALLVLVIFVPARQGASPTAKVPIAIGACTLMAWGIKQVEAARKRSKRPTREHHHNDT